MGKETKIAWTDHTFNPWMGCEKVSEGCRNCYAATFTKNRMGLQLWGKAAPRQVTTTPWRNVRQWNKQAEADGVIRRVFCASLCDVFEDHPIAEQTRPAVWDIIRESQSLDFQLLTKRPQRIADCLPDDWGDGWDNVWLGTSIEDMRVAKRADYLRQVPARVRFISYEPALGSLNDLDLAGLHWIIYGGESGPGYRPEDKQWARDMRDRCRDAGVAFYHKQSAAPRTEMGIDLDGEIIREYPRQAREWSYESSH